MEIDDKNIEEQRISPKLPLNNHAINNQQSVVPQQLEVGSQNAAESPNKMHQEEEGLYLKQKQFEIQNLKISTSPRDKLFSKLKS